MTHKNTNLPTVFHLEAWFSGRVQGVGFRYQTLNMASPYMVCGFVKNLPDGRVHLVLEGEQNEVEAFFAALQREMAAYIKSTETTSCYQEASFDSFNIVH